MDTWHRAEGVEIPATKQSSGAERSERFEIGTAVYANGVYCGNLVRVIVDPIAQTLTHLVVAPEHHRGLGRLVPVDLVRAANPSYIELLCSELQYAQLDHADDMQFLPADTDLFGYGTHALLWPYYGLGMPLRRPDDGHEPMLVDLVPLGEIEVHRGDPVHATDGWIGAVQGLVIDREDDRVTHLILQEGHLAGRKQVAIPIGAVLRGGREIRLKLTREQVEALPPIELDETDGEVVGS